MGRKKNVLDFKKGQHVLAKMGRGIPEKQVFVRSIKGKEAHISWNIGHGRREVVDAHIHVRNLKPLKKTRRRRR